MTHPKPLSYQLTLEDSLRIKIGPVVIALETSEYQSIRLPASYASFLTAHRPNLQLEILSATPESTSCQSLLFESGAGWDICYLNNEEMRITLRRRGAKIPAQIVTLSSDLASGRVHVMEKQDTDRVLPYPLLEPLDNILTTMMLSKGYGMLIHACGISINNKGLLFIGDSGSGKSTLASLWAENSQATIFSDDHIIVSQHNNRFRIHGTPWHSRNPNVSASCTELTHIFFIDHGMTNQVTPLTQIQSCSALMTHSFPTYWDKAGLDYTLRFAAHVAKQIPTYRMGFVPTQDVLDFILWSTTI